VRDQVRTYRTLYHEPGVAHTVADYVRWAEIGKALPEKFTMFKLPTSFHSSMVREVPAFFYGAVQHDAPFPYPNRGLLTETGFDHLVACVTAAKETLGAGYGMAVDAGPGYLAHDALRFAKALEPLHLLWVEDMITGDYVPFVNPDVYREVTSRTTTPIHTGEQIYLRQNFKQLIESHAVNIVGPDPCDVGGIAELKWIAEYADLHGIAMAPHGIANGLIGLAALVQVSAALPENYIAFELPWGRPAWWHDILLGLPDPIVKDGFIEVWDTAGLGVRFDVERARPYLAEGDRGFFD
jgi:L-alanine-DL-glutamate epimerase-like enolase superfamily enzyme